tara:strand:- start:1981 stop:2454 length:474 start_codon:yes stop_codon:yes gene_type:complete
MEISKQELEQIIKEEIDTAVEEGMLDRLRARASGVGGAVKGVGKRAAGAARYAATGEAPSTAGAIGGTYGRGKKVKIIDLHKKKMEKVWQGFSKNVLARAEEFKKDVDKLGLGESEVVQQMKEDFDDTIENLSSEGEKISSYFAKLTASLSSGERTE